MNIPFSKVMCDGNELKYVKEVLESGWLTTAVKAQKLEELFASAVEAKYACCVSSCTAALHLSLEALGIKEGDKVFVPSMTFTATAEVIRYFNADPVFLDIEYGTSLITPSILNEAVKKFPNVRYLNIVHFGGQAATMTSENGNDIVTICKQNNIKIIEDAAHAFPARINGKMIGSIGDATCFSFYANKTITTAEGGMITTNNEDNANRIKIMRLHGINKDIWQRYISKKPNWEYDIIAPGFKYNMPDVNAAIGLAQLERAEELRSQRQRCADFYFENLQDIKCIDLPIIHGDNEDHAWHLFFIVINKFSSISRNSSLFSIWRPITLSCSAVDILSKISKSCRHCCTATKLLPSNPVPCFCTSAVSMASLSVGFSVPSS